MNEDLNLNEEKNDILGELDRLNCLIGLAKSFIKDKKIKKILTDIQNDIFVIQANLAEPAEVISLPQNITLERVIDIQKQTYLIERDLIKLDHFIIPEGTSAACFLHCVRTTARQIERKIPGYLEEPTVIAKYFDRIACLMFASARYLNKKHNFKENPPKYFANKDQKPKKGGKNEQAGR